MIYHEKKPDHYLVGEDCSVTIHSNANGRGDAEAIEKLIREYFMRSKRQETK